MCDVGVVVYRAGVLVAEESERAAHGFRFRRCIICPLAFCFRQAVRGVPLSRVRLGPASGGPSGFGFC